MSKNCRILFHKTGLAKYISHLDLMRTMQRGFIRAGIIIKHTEGFNPHPYMAFALPLSVCCESVCELMDCTVVDDSCFENIPKRLTAALPEGITVIKAFEPTTKFKEIQYARFSSAFEYDSEAFVDAMVRITELFKQDEIVVSKKTKKGIADTNIAPMIKTIDFTESGSCICVNAVLPVQNPALNPEYIIKAIKNYCPDALPKRYTFKREEVYNANMEIFR